jgi:hypothetical protein
VWELIRLALGKSKLDCNVFALYIPKRTQTLPERIDASCRDWSRASRQESDPWDFRRLLRLGRRVKRKEQSARETKRKGQRAKRKADVFFSHKFVPVLFRSLPCSMLLAPCYFMTLSARARTFGGIF